MNTQPQITPHAASCKDDLLEKLAALAERENQATLEFLLQLAEVDRHKPYLLAGYSSTFDYLTRKLRYSEPAANRRIACARAIREFPSLAEDLRLRSLSLTTLSMITGILNPENLAAALSAVRNRSRREVEAYLAGLRPRTALPREELKPLCVVTPDQSGSIGIFAALEQKLSMNPAAAGEGKLQMQAPGTAAKPAPDAEPSAERRYQLKFTISARTQAKLEEARGLLSGKYPCGVKLEDLFEEALELLLERRSPERAMARRAARAGKGKSCLTRFYPPRAGTRHIAAAVREAVYVRDEGRCAFVSADGVRCGARHDLELDHIRPFSRGGGSGAQNLRCLCRAHNLLEARRAYGEVFMAGKIAPAAGGAV